MRKSHQIDLEEVIKSQVDRRAKFEANQRDRGFVRATAWIPEDQRMIFSMFVSLLRSGFPADKWWEYLKEGVARDLGPDELALVERLDRQHRPLTKGKTGA